MDLPALLVTVQAGQLLQDNTSSYVSTEQLLGQINDAITAGK